jgi:hypothetical protein
MNERRKHIQLIMDHTSKIPPDTPLEEASVILMYSISMDATSDEQSI